MGSYLQVHTGAYIDITTDPKSEKVVTVKCRNHPDKKYYEGNEFCVLCGEKLTKTTTEKEGKLNYWDLFENEEEEEKYEDVLIWVCEEFKTSILLIGNRDNKDMPDSIDTEYIDTEYGDIEITQEMIFKYKENFKQNYKEIIEFLRTRVNMLEIKFGVVLYYDSRKEG